MAAIFFTSPRSTVSHASFSPDTVNEQLNKSVLTSPSTARLGSKFTVFYLLLTVTRLPNARFSVTEEESGLNNNVDYLSYLKVLGTTLCCFLLESMRLYIVNVYKI